MRLNTFFAGSLVVLSASASAQAESLFDYIAYAKSGIKAECSDYLGKVASQGSIELGDFLIRSPDLSSCALSSGTRVNLSRGGVQYSNEQWACIASPKVEGTGTYLRQSKRSSIDYNALNLEMDLLSTTLANTKSSADVVVMELNGDDSLYQTTLTLTANKGQTLVVNVRGRFVSIQNSGIKLVGGVQAKNIIWNFYQAESLRIRYAGTDRALHGNLGMPGTFLAPKATVNFNDALITGALYANKIIGRAETPGICTGSVAGQINPGCFESGPLNMGCGSTPVDHPDQRQGDQSQDPRPGNRQKP